MGSRFSKKKHSYDLESGESKGKKKSKKSGKLNRRWKSVDVYTQTGEDEKAVMEIVPRVKAAMSVDDLRGNNAVERPRANGSRPVGYTSSSDSSDCDSDKKKKKKKRKMKKTKDKKNKNNDNERKKAAEKLPAKDDLDASVVIKVSDVSDIESRRSTMMVTNPVYMASAGLPVEQRIRPASCSSSDADDGAGAERATTGDDLANEILEVVTSAQHLEESREIENLPDPPPVPRPHQGDILHETYEGLAKVQLRRRKSSSSSSSSSSNDINRQIPPIANDPRYDDTEIVYENAILRVDRNQPVVPIPFPEDLVEPEAHLERPVRRSRSTSSSSSSSSDAEVVDSHTRNIVIAEDFYPEESPCDDPPQDQELIATAIDEEVEPDFFNRHPQSLIFEEVDLEAHAHAHTREGSPDAPRKPPRLQRQTSASSSSSSSSSSEEGELVVSAEPAFQPSGSPTRAELPEPEPQPPRSPTPAESPEPEPQPPRSPTPAELPEPEPQVPPPAEITVFATVMSAAVVQDTVETIKIQAVLLTPTPTPPPEPVDTDAADATAAYDAEADAVGDAPGHAEVSAEQPEESRVSPIPRSRSSSSSSSSSDSD